MRRPTTCSSSGASGATSTASARARVIHLDIVRAAARPARRRVHPAVHDVRAQRHLLQLRGQAQPRSSRASTKPPLGRSTPQTLFAQLDALAAARAAEARDPGPRRPRRLHRSTPSTLHDACSARSSRGSSASRRRSCPTASAPTAATSAFRSRNIKLVAWGLFHGLADGGKMLLKENFTPHTYDRFSYTLAPWVVFTPVLLVFAVIPFGGTLVPGRAAADRSRRCPAWFGERSYPMQIARARCRPAGRVRVRRIDDPRHDARRLVLEQQVLAAGRARAPPRR